VQLPGRESRLKEAPISDVQHMAEQVVAGLNGMWDRPFALLGHSYGSVLAFEIARRLCNVEGVPLLRVFASGRHAPHLPEPHPICSLPDLLFLREIQRLNGTMLDLLGDAALREVFLPSLRADYTANETYLCDASGTLLTCPLSVFGGQTDPSVSEIELKAWSRLTMATFRLRTFPGDHFFLYSATATVLQAICEDLLGGEP
jgi:surfactin synthase thioesterase subunit